MNQFRLIIALLSFAGFAAALQAYDVVSHSGRTDKNGCHVEKSTGTRHCH